MVNLPKISVVSPVYNAAGFIHQTINSLLRQTYTNWEFILVDDCSTDNSADIIASFSASDNRIKYLKMDVNTGSARLPLNRGYACAEGEFIVGIGHDDILSDNYLELMMSRQIETGADVVLARMCPFGDDSYKKVPNEEFDMNQIIDGKSAVAMTIGDWQLSLNGRLASKDIVLRRLEYSKKYPNSTYMNSDELDGRFLLFLANKVAFADASYNYRIIQSSITHKISVKLYERLFVDRQLDEFICREYGVDDELAKKMRRVRFNAIMYWTDELFLSLKQYSKSEKGKILKIIKLNYSSQNLSLLRKETTDHSSKWKIAYCYCFCLFFINRLYAMKKYL